MRIRTMTALALIAVAAACGGDDEEAGSSDTTRPATETLTVRVVAEEGGGLGCVRAGESSGLDIGIDARLVVEDADDGGVVGTGTFELSPGLVFGEDSCDWTAAVPDVPTSVGFYRLEAGGEVATVSADEIDERGWTLDVDISTSGRVTITDP